MLKKIQEAFKTYKEKLLLLIKCLKIPSFAVIIGFLGAYAGSHGTSLLWRRLGISIVSMVYAYYWTAKTVGVLQALWTITVMAMWGPLAMGYGIPDDDYPENPGADDGSTMGRFWTLFFRKYKNRQDAHRWADYMTRGLIGLMKGLSFLSVPILLGNWVIYGLCVAGITASDALISWRPWGSFKKTIFGKEIEFNWSDIANYTIQGTLIYVLITFKLL